MSLKQDRQGARTAADLERRYNFGKSFAELKGIALDAQTHATKAEELAMRVQQQILDIDVVKELNVSAGTIILKSKGLSIKSEGFSLSADEGIKTVRGNIGKWDISESGISKATSNYFVKIASPDSDDDDVITVSKIENGLVTAVPFCLRADGFGKIGGFTVKENGFEYVKSEDPGENPFYTEERFEYTTGGVSSERRYKYTGSDITFHRYSTEIRPEGLWVSIVGDEIPISSEISFATLKKGSSSYGLYADLNDMTVKVRSYGG